MRAVFLRGAAVLAGAAALVAITAVLSGSFGETEWKIFGTLAAAFVGGSVVVAGLACIERNLVQPLGVAGVALGGIGLLLWFVEIWDETDSESYWKVIGIVTGAALAVLVATTTRLMLRSPSLVGTLYPATAAAAGGAALVATVMLLRERGEGWQLLAVLLILALLGELLAPILESMRTEEVSPAQSSDRILGVLGGAEVVAVRGRESHVVQIGGMTVRLDPSESVVVRERTV
jgi:hypothetical protein